ncbi:hypothetical protein [Caulobacter sp. B11]|uniref:hypothetical protein n=1 Tax=Caulobacter sp. B11 TaxID=2048899 RepID=UPI001374771F|nr:hypothetical protein [Caulobacter sp. B11]
MSHPKIDYRDLIPNDPAMIVEIVRQAEERFKMQVQFALASDARAGAMATWTSAMAGGFVIAAMGTLSGGAKVGALAAGLTFGLAAFCSIWAARPISFGCIGTLPNGWVDVVRDNEKLNESLAGYAAHLDGHLLANEDRMKLNGSWTRGAMWCMFMSPFVSLAAALLFA